MMEPFWPYYAFLISWIQCFIVVWLAVSIETQSTDVSSVFNNSTSETTTTTLDSSTKSVGSFIDVVMPTCPPPNNLHLLCNVSLAGNNLNCKERADILELCWNTSSEIYDKSTWSECETSCKDVVDFLVKISIFAATTTKPTVITTQFKTTKTTKVPVSVTSSVTSKIYTISTSASNITSSSTSSSSPPSSPGRATSTKATSTVIPPIISSPQSGKTMANDREPDFPPLSYVYPLVGCIGILIEVVFLCYIFCIRKRKQHRLRRRPSQEPVVVQEEMMEAESTNPTQALCNGPGALTVPDVIAEDQHIFRSYLNLRFIDDSSLEGTPEKIIYK